MRFEKLKLQHAEKITNAVSAPGFLSCQLSAVSLFCYAEKYQTEICFSDGFIFIKQSREGFPVCYFLPVSENGSSSELLLGGAVERLYSYHKENHSSEFVLWGIADDMLAGFEKAAESLTLSGSLTSDRNWAEYIHAPENLIDMKGKRFHAKKNAVNQFLRNNSDYAYEPLDNGNIKDVLRFQESLISGSRKFETNPGTLKTLDEEHLAIMKALDNFSVLSLKGGIIRIDGNVCAFALGGDIGVRSFDVAFEKALRSYNGIFQVLEQDMLKANVCGYEYINREEDLGEPGIRFAKERLRPDILLMKHTFIAIS